MTLLVIQDVINLEDLCAHICVFVYVSTYVR